MASFPDALARLLAMPPVTIPTLPPAREMPESGIYWLAEGDTSIYVGRSRHIRKRLQQHVRPSSDHSSASFAFLLARETTGNRNASYQQENSREALMRQPDFEAAFEDAKERISRMDVRFVEENHAVRQCLLEVYVATAVGASHNNFDSH